MGSRMSWRDMRPRFYVSAKGLTSFNVHIGLDGHFWAQVGRVVFTTSPR